MLRDEQMKKAWFWIVLVLCAAALAASAALFIDYMRPGPVFCSEGGGCAALKHTAWGHPLGIPTPVIGVSGLLAIAISAMLRGERARRAQALLAVVGGAGALTFIGVQIALKTVCPYCMVVDSSTVLLMGLSIARWRFGWDPPERRAELIGAVGLLLNAIGLPISIGLLRTPQPPPIAVSPETPPIIISEMRKSPKGVITVVDFIDFECPFCRATHKELGPVLAEYKGRVRLVRKQVPLRMHPHATDAAKAACCGELLGKSEEMADALVEADADQLTPEGCEKIAEKLGLDLTRFRACVKDPATEARLKADAETFKEAKGRGLPMLYVGEQRLVGEQDKESLKEAFDKASRSL
jgi:protein-disulfide isomerase/uncharacterized membrane protein